MNTTPANRFCAFCGLPLPASFSSLDDAEEDRREYCCSGCRSVSTVLAAQEEDSAAARGMLRLGLAVFFTMNVMVFTMALWSGDLYPAESFTSPLAVSLRHVFRWASLVFSLPVIYLLGGPIAAGVWQALRARSITTDLLILGGVLSAYAYSVVSVLRGEGHVYFEVGAMVLVFVSLGRYLEARGKRRAGTSLDGLASLLPDTVRRFDETDHFVEFPREELSIHDQVRVLPGERLPVDGQITLGTALVDEQIVTGESTPVEKCAGDYVYSGTLNLDGDLQVTVTAADGQETISRIVNLVRQARSIKGRHERIADRIAVYFVPLVCLIALGAGWYRSQLQGLDQGILTALSVVLIACPCALGMATPMAVWSALGRAVQSGLLFRSGVVLEKLAGVRSACFDKTGTLTTGQPAVTEFVAYDSTDARRSLEVAGTLTSGSTHPLSVAVTRFVERNQLHSVDGHVIVESHPGRGLSAEIPGLGKVLLGSQRWMRDSDLSESSNVCSGADVARQRVFLGWGGKVRGEFRFQEQLRPESVRALDACRQLGLTLHLLTGDSSARALPWGEKLGLVAKTGLLPEQKVSTLQELSQQGPIAMVGDGLNDAPALAQADVGVALGCGADVSRDAAGVCLLSDDLLRFPWAIGLARTTVHVIKQNLFWAFAYNTIGIGLAATGRLNPIWAALAMAISSIMVVANSLRLAAYPEPIAEGHNQTEQFTEPLFSRDPEDEHCESGGERGRHISTDFTMWAPSTHVTK